MRLTWESLVCCQRFHFDMLGNRDGLFHLLIDLSHKLELDFLYGIISNESENLLC